MENGALANALKPHLIRPAPCRHDETRLLQRQKRRRWAAIARNVREEEARRRWRVERNDLRARSGTTERNGNGERRSVRAPFAKKTLASALRLSAVSDLVTDLPGVVRRAFKLGFVRRSSTRWRARQERQRHFAAIRRVNVQRRAPHAEDEIRQQPQQHPKPWSAQIVAREELGKHEQKAGRARLAQGQTRAESRTLQSGLQDATSFARPQVFSANSDFSSRFCFQARKTRDGAIPKTLFHAPLTPVFNAGVGAVKSVSAALQKP